MREFIIQKNDAGQRLDKFIAKAVKKLPKSLLYKSVRLKRIKRNGARCEISTILEEGDVLSLYLNDEFFEDEKAFFFLDAPAKLSIVYEDANILLVDKEPGLVVHEDNRRIPDCLINRVKHYLYQKGKYDPQKENSFAPAICNRIDRNTGGLVIAAKNAEALRTMNAYIRDRKIKKFYLCLTEGIVEPSEGVLRGYLSKDVRINKVSLSKQSDGQNKEAITKYHVMRTDQLHSLVEAELVTGRSHQIRAQFSQIGHPLVGDVKYGAKEKNKYHALYAYRLTFELGDDDGLFASLNQRTFQVKKVWFADQIS